MGENKNISAERIKEMSMQFKEKQITSQNNIINAMVVLWVLFFPFLFPLF